MTQQSTPADIDPNHDPNGRYIMKFHDFDGKQHTALITDAEDIVEAAEIGEQEYAEILADPGLIQSEASYIKEKQDLARERAQARKAELAKQRAELRARHAGADSSFSP